MKNATGVRALYEGQVLVSMNTKDIFKKRRHIQTVFQNPTQSINPGMSIVDIIPEAFVSHPEILPKQKWERRVCELRGRVGLKAGHMHLHLHQIAGGQRQRIAIAGALALQPKLIVCGEAVSSLYIAIQAQIFLLSTGLQNALGQSYLFVAHDPVEKISETPLEAHSRNLVAADLSPVSELQAERRKVLRKMKKATT